MRRIKTRISIILVIAMVLGLSAIPLKLDTIAKVKKPKLSKVSVTLKQDEQAEVYLKNVSKKRIKKTTIVSPNESFVDAWVERKTVITLSHGMGFGEIKIPVIVTLKKKIAGKKTYKFKIKVTVVPDEDDTPVIRSSFEPKNTSTPQPLITLTPTITPSVPTQSSKPVLTVTPTVAATSTPTRTERPKVTPVATNTLTPDVYQGDVVYISNPNELLTICGYQNIDKTFVLKNDIDMSNIESSGEKFYGILEGNGKHISNLSMPLFKYNLGIIKSIVFDNVSIGDDSINRITRENKETSLGGQVGVVAMINTGTIKNCKTFGHIYQTRSLSEYVDPYYGLDIGGIVAENCKSYGGTVSGKIINCESDVIISVYGYEKNSIMEDIEFGLMLGGISGLSNGMIEGSIFTGSIVKNSENTWRHAYVGGIVGRSEGGEIKDCCNLGALNTDHGGIVLCGSGICDSPLYSTKVENCYNAGNSKNGISECSPDSDGYIINAYYTQGEWNFSNINRNIRNMKKITETESKSEQTFLGFDFDSVWIMTQNGPDLRWRF